MQKFEIVNYLANKYNFTTFLEISSPTTGMMYDQVHIQNKSILYYDTYIGYCRNDVGRDATSYENELNNVKDNTYDIIFVDPYHTFEQSKKDIELAFELTNNIVIVHDCLPPFEGATGNVRSQGAWCGQTYEAFIDFKTNHPNVLSYVIDTDYGCGIIYKNKVRDTPYVLLDDYTASWTYFDANKTTLLDIISVDDFKNNDE